MPEIKILGRIPFKWTTPEGKPVESTYVTYQDERGLVGSLTIDKKAPSDAEILAEIKRRKPS